MLPFSSLIQPALLIIVPLTLGLLIQYFGILEGLFEKLYKLVVVLVLPALVFGAIAVERPPGILSFGSISSLALIGLGATSLAGMAGTYIVGLGREKSTEIFINGVFMNYTFLGLAVVQSILGSTALGKASIYAVTVGIIHLTVGMVLTRTSAGKDVKVTQIIYDILTFPAAFLLIVALLFVIFRVPVPYEGLAEAGYDNYANLASFLMVLATGYKMKIGGFRKYFSTMIGVGFLRLFICPFATWMAIQFFRIEGSVAQIALLLSVMPPGVFNIILAERFNLDIESYSSTVFYLTLISLLVAVPLLLHFTMFPYSLF